MLLCSASRLCSVSCIPRLGGAFPYLRAGGIAQQTKKSLFLPRLEGRAGCLWVWGLFFLLVPPSRRAGGSTGTTRGICRGC